MLAAEAEYLKNVTFKALRKRPWTDFRIQMLKYCVVMLTYNTSHDYEEEICYKLIPFHGGCFATLCEILTMRHRERERF